MYPHFDKKAIEEGIYQRMNEIIGSPNNQFPVEAAYNEIITREKEIADGVRLIRSHYLAMPAGVWPSQKLKASWRTERSRVGSTARLKLAVPHIVHPCNRHETN